MLVKKIKFVDYNGEEREENFYFNLSKAEIMEMQLEVSGGLTAVIERITQEKNVPELIKMFKDLILRSVGIKSDDGRRFIKSEKIREEFSQTEAYSNLFMELAQDADAAADFINGIVPAEYAAEAKKQIVNK